VITGDEGKELVPFLEIAVGVSQQTTRFHRIEFNAG
jgi:hypothetical protein